MLLVIIVNHTEHLNTFWTHQVTFLHHCFSVGLFSLLFVFCQYDKKFTLAWLNQFKFIYSCWKKIFLLTVLPLEKKIHISTQPCNILCIFLFWTTINNKVTYLKTTYFICFLHSLWATWMCCLSFLKESICTIPCVLCWCAWRHTSVWVQDVSTVLVFKLLSLKMICQQSMSVREKILLEEVSCSYSLTPVSCTATQLIQPDFNGSLETGLTGFHWVLASTNWIFPCWKLQINSNDVPLTTT